MAIVNISGCLSKCNQLNSPSLECRHSCTKHPTDTQLLKISKKNEFKQNLFITE